MPNRRQRTDAERRARQSERLSRLFRVFRCIMGAGRWDAESLARELEVSERTVHRLMQTLSMAGVPWYYCKDNECYRVRPGFKFPGLDVESGPCQLSEAELTAVTNLIRQALKDGEALARSLQKLCMALDASNSRTPRGR